MNKQIEEKLHTLAHLYENAQNKKILMEEMRLLANKAFQLQDELMALLDAQESKEQNIEAVQELFDIRECVWDTMNKIALREMEIKEKTFSKDTYQTKAPIEPEECAHEHCHCSHESEDCAHGHCHCSHEIEECAHTHCHCAQEKARESCRKGKGACQKKKTIH